MHRLLVLRLESKRLIRSERSNRVRRVYMLLDDGSGEEYERPDGSKRGFFGLPFVYFTDRWHRELSLPGKAALLIALAQPATFTLVTERAAGWYGVPPTPSSAASTSSVTSAC